MCLFLLIVVPTLAFFFQILAEHCLILFQIKPLEVENYDFHLERKVGSREGFEECKTHTCQFLSKDNSITENHLCTKLVDHHTRLKMG